MIRAKAVAFDAYGTLGFVSKPLQPYQRLLQTVPRPPDELRRLLMTHSGRLAELLKMIGLDDSESVRE